MSGSRFGVTPQIPATITGIFPIIVAKSGLAYEISYGASATDMAGAVTRRQWFSAVATLYDMNQLVVAVGADANTPAWIQFYAGATVVPGDDLANFTQTALVLSNAQMTTLFVLAASQTP